MVRPNYAVVVVHSTSHAIRAEHVLNQAGIPAKLIPVPRQVSSMCGVCVRIDRSAGEGALDALQKAGMEVEGVHDIG